MNPQFRVVAMIVFACLCSGCFGGGSLPLVSVNGTVTLNGEPLADARVIFYPEAGGRPSSGLTDEDGHFELVYIEGRAGALSGRHKVSISTLIEADPDSSDPLTSVGQRERVPASYNTQTALTVKVESGSSEELRFDLKT